MKKIIFFDADGTLWYPRSTKSTQKPHWIYAQLNGVKAYCDELVVMPTVIQTLKQIRKMGIVTVVLSASPHAIGSANDELKFKIAHFGLNTVFDEVYATRNYPESKGRFIKKILARRGLSKREALMIGDSYLWDYKSARDVGVEALLMDSDYRKIDPAARRIKRAICELKEIIDYL